LNLLYLFPAASYGRKVNYNFFSNVNYGITNFSSKHWHLGAQSCAGDTHLFYGLLLPSHFIWLHGNSRCFLYYNYFVFSLSFNINLVTKNFAHYLHYGSNLIISEYSLVDLSMHLFFFAIDACLHVTIQLLHKHANLTNHQWTNRRPDADICLPLLYISHRYYRPLDFVRLHTCLGLVYICWTKTNVVSFLSSYLWFFKFM
jgi:hypothetical protein